MSTEPRVEEFNSGHGLLRQDLTFQFLFFLPPLYQNSSFESENSPIKTDSSLFSKLERSKLGIFLCCNIRLGFGNFEAKFMREAVVAG
jgi:hypothetical protein